MGLFGFLSGKTPERLLEKGEQLYEKGQFGHAKIEYEKARTAYDKRSTGEADLLETLNSKISLCCEKLAGKHLETAGELLTAHCIPDALERLDLALALTTDSTLKQEITKMRQQCRGALEAEDALREVGDVGAHGDMTEGTKEVHDLDAGGDAETFEVLIQTLSPGEQAVYTTYGPAFVEGVVALNQGDFQRAVARLQQAMDDSPAADTYIGLELGTALLNLGELEQAGTVLRDFLSFFSESVRGYQVLCEVLWMRKDFAGAHDLLDRCPPEIARRVSMILLKGETWVLQGDLKAAAAFYQEMLEGVGTDVHLLRALAGIETAMGNDEKAFQIYSGLMASCTGCGQRPDMDLQRRFADAAVTTGRVDSRVVDIYLELASTDPENRSECYKKVSEIYRHLGNIPEAERFNEFIKG